MPATIKHKKMHNDCIVCFLQQADKLLAKHKVEENMASLIISRFNLFIEEHKNNNLSAPEVASVLHRMIKSASNIDDLYKKEKKEYNDLLMSLEGVIRDEIVKSDDPFQVALRYALAGNIIDFGPPKQFDVFKTLSSAVNKKPAIDHTNILKKELNKAKTVLYLGDNAGEIVLDKLFIETINHPNLYFAVRGGCIINDVTMEDAGYVGMAKDAKIISNGYDAPSTIINRCSKQFKKLFKEADIIISKGQGNLEGLIDVVDKKIFFLLMVKCNVIGELINVKEGDVVVFYNQKKEIKQ